MKYSLLVVSRRTGDRLPLISGYWVQNHVGTYATARQRADAVEQANSHAITVAIVDELPSVVPWMHYWEGRLEVSQ